MANTNGDINPSGIAIVMIIVWIAGMMNSLVYGVFYSRFRNGFKRLLLCDNKVGPVES